MKRTAIGMMAAMMTAAAGLPVSIAWAQNNSGQPGAREDGASPVQKARPGEYQDRNTDPNRQNTATQTTPRQDGMRRGDDRANSNGLDTGRGRQDGMSWRNYDYSEKVSTPMFGSWKDAVGMDVKNLNDEEIGEVSDLVIDRGSGRIQFVALRTGQVLGMGGRQVLVPYEQLGWDDMDKKVVLRTSAEDLRGYAAFDANAWDVRTTGNTRNNTANNTNNNTRNNTATNGYDDRALAETLARRAALDEAGMSTSAWGNNLQRETVTGTVTRVDRRYVPGLGDQVVVGVKGTDGREQEVVMGPAWYMGGESITPTRNEQVTVTAVRAPINLSTDDVMHNTTSGATQLVAMDVTREGRTTTLRDTQYRGSWQGEWTRRSGTTDSNRTNQNNWNNDNNRNNTDRNNSNWNNDNNRNNTDRNNRNWNDSNRDSTRPNSGGGMNSSSGTTDTSSNIGNNTTHHNLGESNQNYNRTDDQNWTNDGNSNRSGTPAQSGDNTWHNNAPNSGTGTSGTGSGTGQDGRSGAGQDTSRTGTGTGAGTTSGSGTGYNSGQDGNRSGTGTSSGTGRGQDGNRSGTGTSNSSGGNWNNNSGNTSSPYTNQPGTSWSSTPSDWDRTWNRDSSWSSWDRDNPTDRTAVRNRYVLASKWIGRDVTSGAQDAGDVEDLVVEWKSGTVAFVAIDPDDNFLGIGDKDRLVPFSVCSISYDGNVRVDGNKEMILASKEVPGDYKKLNVAATDPMYSAFGVRAPDYTIRGYRTGGNMSGTREVDGRDRENR